MLILMNNLFIILLFIIDKDSLDHVYLSVSEITVTELPCRYMRVHFENVFSKYVNPFPD